MANGANVQLIDLIREILHSKFEVSGQQRIRANYQASHKSELREQMFTIFRDTEAFSDLSDDQIEQAVDEFFEAIKERLS
jgi:hypothetical protein